MKKLALLTLVLALGCSTVEQEQAEMIRGGRALLRDRSADHVLDPEWQQRRAQWLTRADLYADTAPVTTPSGGK